jgi:hypothetical protein
LHSHGLSGCRSAPQFRRQEAVNGSEEIIDQTFSVDEVIAPWFTSTRAVPMIARSATANRMAVIETDEAPAIGIEEGERVFDAGRSIASGCNAPDANQPPEAILIDVSEIVELEEEIKRMVAHRR